METVRQFDAAALDGSSEPYPMYQWLRDNHPVYHVADRKWWVVSRYEDVVAVARNFKVFSSTGGVGPDWRQEPMMPMYDPPQHTRMRRLVSAHFTPKAVERLRENVRGRAARLLGDAIERRSADLVQEIAVPLSLGTIATILGVPADHFEHLRKWSLEIIKALAGGLSDEVAAQVDAKRREFVVFLREMVDERKASNTRSEDLISLLLSASEGDRLTDNEVIAFCVLLLVAGFETTVNGIANGVVALVDHPEQLAKVQANQELCTSLTEEVVRYDCPVQSFFRNTLSDIELHGVTIPRESKVMVLFASANRDERKFGAADEFRADRFHGLSAAQVDHVGFGAGVHYCLGAPLARLQMNCFYAELFRQTRGFELAEPAIRTGTVLFRGVERAKLNLVASV